MKFKFEIYQMESDNPNKFKELENTEINKSDYKKVYEGEVIVDSFIIIDQVLDKIFEKFNINHPTDFTCHSLSISDIVKINDDAYYCQPIGWKNINMI